MKLLLTSLVLVLVLQVVVGPPVTANKKGEGDKQNEEKKDADWDLGLEYNRYLQEVVQALESDPQFREKLEKAEVADIRTGKIASELEFVNHNVRSKLDELKRQELERLRHLAIKEYEIQQAQKMENGDDEEDGDENEIDHKKKVQVPFHLDHHNPHSFEIEDLRKLIVQTTKDLDEADQQRRKEFKEYEMQKEYEKNQQLNLLDEEHKKEFEHKIEEQEKKHKSHPNLHHPGSKQQFQEVWEEQDHMNPDDFNPKTFFHMHDLDGNGVWDTDEVKALFQKELDKMYDPNAPEDDMKERREEMERMREHVFNESDTNKDHLISYEEFLAQTKRKEYEQDQGWQGLDDQKLYTHEEYLEFERKRQEEVQRMIAQGMLPPQPQEMHLPYGIQVPPEYFHHQQQQAAFQQAQHNPQLAPHHAAQQQVHHQAPPMQGHPAQFQQHPQQGQQMHHPNSVPQQQQQQYHQQPPQQYHQQPPQQYHQQPPPPQQYNQQPPPQQFNNQQPPPQQYQNQPPQQQYNNHPPPPQQYNNQQPPPQQYNQVPQQQQNSQQAPPQYQQQNQHPNSINQGHQNQPAQNPPAQNVHNQAPPPQQSSSQTNQNQPPISNAPPVQVAGQQNQAQVPVQQQYQPPVKQHNSPPLHNQQPAGGSVVHNSPPVVQRV